MGRTGRATDWEKVAAGEELPVFERETGFGEWNRFAAVNDEFIDVHMDRAAAQAAGQPDIFGMGNLRISYVHNALRDALAGAGEIVEFGCQFRQLNLLGDRLRTQCVVTGSEVRQGARLVRLDVNVLNQKDEGTMPGDAALLLFDDAKASQLPAPPETAVPADREPGAYLDEKTLGWLGRPLEADVALPVGANEIRRWTMATYHPEEPPPVFMDEAVAAGSAWGELVAPCEINPFAWTKCQPPDSYPWMRGMGTEPGRRGLNGGQRNRYFAPIRVGDVITQVVRLVDAYEKEGKLGPMMFLVDEARWSNQRGELVRIGQRTTIYY